MMCREGVDLLALLRLAIGSEELEEIRERLFSGGAEERMSLYAALHDKLLSEFKEIVEGITGRANLDSREVLNSTVTPTERADLLDRFFKLVYIEPPRIVGADGAYDGAVSVLGINVELVAEMFFCFAQRTLEGLGWSPTQLTDLTVEAKPAEDRILGSTLGALIRVSELVRVMLGAASWHGGLIGAGSDEGERLPIREAANVIRKFAIARRFVKGLVEVANFLEGLRIDESKVVNHILLRRLMKHYSGGAIDLKDRADGAAALTVIELIYPSYRHGSGCEFVHLAEALGNSKIDHLLDDLDKFFANPTKRDDIVRRLVKKPDDFDWKSGRLNSWVRMIGIRPLNLHPFWRYLDLLPYSVTRSLTEHGYVEKGSNYINEFFWEYLINDLLGNRKIFEIAVLGAFLSDGAPATPAFTFRTSPLPNELEVDCVAWLDGRAISVALCRSLRREAAEELDRRPVILLVEVTSRKDLKKIKKKIRDLSELLLKLRELVGTEGDPAGLLVSPRETQDSLLEGVPRSNGESGAGIHLIPIAHEFPDHRHRSYSGESEVRIYLIPLEEFFHRPIRENLYASLVEERIRLDRGASIPVA